MPRVAAPGAALLVTLAVFLGIAPAPALATSQTSEPAFMNEVVSTQDVITTDEAPTEIEPEPEAAPDLTIPSPCRGFTTMGNKQLWDSGNVVDPVSKTTVTLGTPINWLANPTNSRSWPIYLHGLAWARGYAADYLQTGNIESLNQALDIVRSHDASVKKTSPAYKAAWKDHPVSLRLTTLACLAAVTPLPNDLTKMMNELAEWQMDQSNYFQRHNHGLMQNISLIRAGCQTGQTRWLNTAWRRMKADFDFAINRAGVNNEQATGYAFFNWRAWAEALDEIDKCPNITVPATTLADFQRRLALLEVFNAHATQPDGFMVPIGDTLVNRTGLLPNSDLPKTAIYQDGYALGRSEWQSPDSMHWSLRFGPKANKHGHDDHLGVTYFVDGKRVLVDGAHAGYDRNSDRAYLVSKAAHNTPTVAGFARAEPKASQLVSNYADDNRAVVTVRDKLPTAKSKRLSDKTPLRTRTLVADYPSKLIATLDRAQGELVNVPWTFAPGFSVSTDQAGRVTASSEKVNPLPDSISEPGLDGTDEPPAPLGRPEIYLFNPETCQPLPVTLSQGRSALGWRQLVSSPRVIASGRAVVSLISPDEVSVSCVIDQGLTRLQVVDKSGLITDFFYSRTQGLR